MRGHPTSTEAAATGKAAAGSPSLPVHMATQEQTHDRYCRVSIVAMRQLSHGPFATLGEVEGEVFCAARQGLERAAGCQVRSQSQHRTGARPGS